MIVSFFVFLLTTSDIVITVSHKVAVANEIQCSAYYDHARRFTQKRVEADGLFVSFKMSGYKCVKEKAV